MPPSSSSPLVVFRGGGELGTAAARLLHLGGYRVVVLERPAPLAVRRLVAFAGAVFTGRVEVEGVAAARVEASALAPSAARDVIPVVVDAEGASVERLGPDALVDARMAKKALDTRLGQARVVVGLGPGFCAGRDVHAVVETQRGPDLGRVIWDGEALGDTSEPAPVLGYTHDRVLRAPTPGVFRSRARLGERVQAGATVGEVEGQPVIAAVSGLLRGLVADGVWIDGGVKLGDVDPRGTPADRISDKARAVAAGVLEAVSLGLARAGCQKGGDRLSS